MILVFSTFPENEGVSGRQEPDNEAPSQTRPSPEDPGRKWVWDPLVTAISRAVALIELVSWLSVTVLDYWCQVDVLMFYEFIFLICMMEKVNDLHGCLINGEQKMLNESLMCIIYLLKWSICVLSHPVLSQYTHILLLNTLYWGWTLWFPVYWEVLPC